MRDWLLLISLSITVSATAQPIMLPLWHVDAHQLANFPSTFQSATPASNVKEVNQPHLYVYTPTCSNRTALLIISGGGYAHQVLGKEGTPAALYFTKQCFTVFELVYRLPDPSNPDLPFKDGQRALRIMRTYANTHQIQHIGVLGFSAGGHLAGMLATTWNHPYYTLRDQIDQASSKPDFAALIYPIISMTAPLNHNHSYRRLLGSSSSLTQQRHYSVQDQVNSSTPPMFLAHAEDDPIAPIQHSLLMQQALEKYQINHQLVTFKTGGHGWGMGKKNTDTVHWADLLQQWLIKYKLVN